MSTTETAPACITNMVTGAQYQGKNIDRLLMATAAGGYDPEKGWAGFHQWRTVGRTVRKGEHGTPCMTIVRVDKGADGSGGTTAPRGFRVFHFDQTDELPTAAGGADDDYGPGPEVARILRELAGNLDFVDEPGNFLKMSGTVRDFNGTTAGRWAFGTGDWDAREGLLLPEADDLPAERTLGRVRELLTDGDWAGVLYDDDVLGAIAEAVGVDRQD